MTDNPYEWYYSADGEFYSAIEPQPSSREEAERVTAYDYDGYDGARFGLARRSPMPSQFPVDVEEIDMALCDHFHEEYLSERYPQEASLLMDMLQQAWTRWLAEARVVGTAMEFGEGPFGVSSKDPS